MLELRNIAIDLSLKVQRKILDKGICQGPNLETKMPSQKKSERREENSPPQAKRFLGFAKRFSEFAKRIYETCDRNFFNLTIIVVVVFSIVQFILCLRFASNN